jgi:DNA-binding transcriptional LysR family regulator
MLRETLADLSVFLAVADERSFTRAAARLGTSQSAVSHSIRRLEAILGIKLLSRTTRNVSVTEAGGDLLHDLRPAFGVIGAKLLTISRFRDVPAGSVRITCSRHAAETILWAAIDQIMSAYPDINIELSLDGTLTNIIAEQFDAVVQLGESLEKDMIAVRIGPDLQMALVASPDYLSGNPAPISPRDLPRHKCINLRNATRRDLYVWKFEKDGAILNVRVEGQFIVNDSALAICAAKAGHGIAYLFEDLVANDIASGKLVRMLQDWCPPFAGHHLYYPDRHDLPIAFSLVVDALRLAPKCRGYPRRPSKTRDTAPPLTDCLRT